ncbi:hypothetical protein [Robinsoniella peoriensis]
MNIVKIDPKIYEFGEVPKEEYLEYFQYKNPVKLEEDTYQVDELGVSLPAVSILERDIPAPDKTQEPMEEEGNLSYFVEQMDAYQQNFVALLTEMEQARLENERKLNQCYGFLREKGLMEAFEKEYGAVLENDGIKEERMIGEGLRAMQIQEAGTEQKEQTEKALQDLEEKKEKIVVPGLNGTWQVVMRLLPGQDKKELFVLKSEISADLEPVLVDRYAQPVSVTSLEYGLSAYTDVVENYRLAQQIVHLIEKQDTILGYEEGVRGWENQMQAIGLMEENITSEAGREWILEELGYIQSAHPELAEEIGKIKEKMSLLQTERTQGQPDKSSIGEKAPAWEEKSRMEEYPGKTKQRPSQTELGKEQEKKAEMTKKKKLSM